MLSQQNEEIIFKNKNGNWEIDQTTSESAFYAIKERDALLKEVIELRKQKKELESINLKLMDKVSLFTNRLSEQLIINQNSTKEVNQTNDKLISVWSKLYKGSHLNAKILTNLNGSTFLGANLTIPIDLKFSFSASALYNVTNKRYEIGLNYSIW